MKKLVYERVEGELPEIVHSMIDEIGVHIDLLLDPKLMVIEQFEANPDLVVRIFKDISTRELKLMVNFGFIFGFLLGIPVAIIDVTLHQWWLLPIMGVIVGWVTNLLGMKLIFEPVEPTLGPDQDARALPAAPARGRRGLRRNHRRRRRDAQEHRQPARRGPERRPDQADDRNRDAPRDRPRGGRDPAGGARRGGRPRVRQDQRAFAREGVDQTLTPFRDPEFSRRQSEKIQKLIAARTREMPYKDFVEMLRSAIKEDEWMLYAHGAVMGLAGGFIHLAIFGVSG